MGVYCLIEAVYDCWQLFLVAVLMLLIILSVRESISEVGQLSKSGKLSLLRLLLKFSTFSEWILFLGVISILMGCRLILITIGK